MAAGKPESSSDNSQSVPGSSNNARRTRGASGIPTSISEKDKDSAEPNGGRSPNQNAVQDKDMRGGGSAHHEPPRSSGPRDAVSDAAGPGPGSDLMRTDEEEEQAMEDR